MRPVGDGRPQVLVITEGVADGLVAAQMGFNTIGVLGSSIGDEYVASAIANLVGAGQPRSRVAICFDADDAGRAGSDRLEQLLSDVGLSATTVRLRTGLDLTDWALADQDWVDRLGSAPWRLGDSSLVLGIDRRSVVFGHDVSTALA